MGKSKKKLFAEPLKTIKEILSEFNFLEYSTRTRNLAYQLQYLEFKINLLNSYSIYGSVRGSLLRELVISTTNIIEYLLFIAIRAIYNKDPKTHKFPSLISQAKSNNLISKQLARDLNEIVQLRNNLHPSKQKNNLDVKCFTQKNMKFCLSTMYALKNDLEEYFSERNIQIKTGESRCPYEGYSQILFDDFLCSYCGELHF